MRDRVSRNDRHERVRVERGLVRPAGAGHGRGRARTTPRETTAPPRAAIAAVQVAAIVVGHVLGVVLAHDRAVREFPRRPTLRQVPLVVVMVAFTVGGLALLLSS